MITYVHAAGPVLDAWLKDDLSIIQVLVIRMYVHTYEYVRTYIRTDRLQLDLAFGISMERQMAFDFFNKWISGAINTCTYLTAELRASSQ